MAKDIPAKDKTQKILVMSNCATSGLANSMRMLNQNIDVRVCPLSNIAAIDRVIANQKWFDVTFLLPAVSRRYPEVEAKLKAVSGQIVYSPTLYFDGYHPDLCYVMNGRKRLNSPIGDYHSGICFAAYTAGLSAEDTVQLYHSETYERIGYYDVWATSRDVLLNDFSSHGHDIRDDFLRWSKSGPFLYSVNHPRIQPLFDISKKLFAAANIPFIEPPFPPNDYLSNGPWFPVYPGIAENCGVEGSYLFKKKQEASFLDLNAFVHESFEIYENAANPTLAAMFHDKPRFQALEQFLGGASK